LTVRFLGEVGSDLDAEARPRWRAAASAVAPFRMRLGSLDRLPASGRPRVLVVTVEEDVGTLGDLAAEV
jgi:2'-5' RNA ligase